MMSMIDMAVVGGLVLGGIILLVFMRNLFSFGDTGSGVYKRNMKDFRRLLDQHFAGYDVSVVPKTCWHEFRLSQHGQAVAVLFWTEFNGHKNPAWWEARRAVEASSAKFVNFYEHMPNRPEYVLSRLAEYGVTPSASSAPTTPPPLA